MRNVELALVKLGGSVVTNKSRLRSFARKNTDRLLGELSIYLSEGRNRGAIVVHGGGSFGHIIAKKYSIKEGFTGTDQLSGFAEVRKDMRDLDARIIELMHSHSMPAVSFPPENLFKVNDGNIISTYADSVLAATRIGLVPVSFGDAVMDRRRTFTILSGDSIMNELSRAARPSVSIFCTDVDGIFTADPKTSPESLLLQSISAASKLNAGSAVGDDVTGGMEGKLRVLFEVAKYSGRTHVVNGNKHGRLSAALNGDATAGTEVNARRRREIE
ncbi:MAG: isopentenyl phosphate kinase family protein [Thermoplasmata archaeon]|nr:isopentenyl phosphate kinase family protein [Candidatus Sysuiplasma acidicola]